MSTERRFLKGDRVELASYYADESMAALKGEYLEQTETGHLVLLDLEFQGYLRAGNAESYITVLAVHDDNIILEET